MKVIDLLNKIANNEKVPEKIFYKGNVYYQVGDVHFNNLCYENCEIDTDEWKFLCAIENLNDEVEIIEEKEQKEIPRLNDIRESYDSPRIEEKKIPEKSNIDFNTKLPVSGCSENEAFMMTCISHLGKTIDSLIDCLKSKGDE